MLSLQFKSCFHRPSLLLRKYSTFSTISYPKLIYNPKSSNNTQLQEDELAREPWLHSANLYPPPELPNGSIVDVYTKKQKFIARGLYSAKSNLMFRRLTSNQSEKIDESFWVNRVNAAVTRRTCCNLATVWKTNAFRLVFADNDLLPGLIVDKYDDWICTSFKSFGIYSVREIIFKALVNHPDLNVSGIFMKNEGRDLTNEQLEVEQSYHYSKHSAPALIQIVEDSCKYMVSMENGHKTGFYLDQREARAFLGKLANGKKVLNLFSYTGGFSINCLINGASHVHNCEISESIVQHSIENHKLNNLPETKFSHQTCDVFDYLTKLRNEYNSTGKHCDYDLIIVDPPKLVINQATLARGTKAYLRINTILMEIMKPGSLLATFSCSGAVGEKVFNEILLQACKNSGREVQKLRSFGLPQDHPSLITYPHFLYLKGSLLAVL